MKQVLLGIALILFGFNLTYVSIEAGWGGVDLLGLGISVVGIVVSLIGGFRRDK